MADTVSVGDLLVRISGDVSGLLASTKKGVAALAEMDTAGGRMAAGLRNSTLLAIGVIAGMAKAIDAAVTSSINKLEELGKTSQQIGVSVEALSRLEFAAKKAGVSADELSQAVKLFARNAGEIRSATEAPDAFVVSMRNLQVVLEAGGGKVRDTTALILDLSDRFSRMPDGVEKTALALKLFGQAGASMIPLLNQGREQMAAYMAQADAMGATMSKDQTDAALKFNNTLRSISGTFDSLIKRVVGEFLPTMENLAQQFNGAIKNAQSMSLAMDGLRVVFNAFVGAGQAVIGVVKGVLEGIGGAARLLKAIATGDWKGAMDAYRETTTTAFMSIFDGFKNGVTTIVGGTDTAKAAMAAWVAGTVVTAATVQEPFKALRQTVGQAAEAHQRARAEFLQGLVLGPSNTAEVIAGLQGALQRGKITFQEFSQAADEALGSKRRLSLIELDAVMSKTTATMEEKMAALQTAVRGGAISFQQYGNDVRDVERQNQQHMLDTASMAASTLTTMFRDNKVASIGAATINTAVGITKALSQQGAFGWVQAGLIAAAGAAQIAAISGASESGAGSSPSVSSGTAAASAPAVQEERTMRVQGFNAKEFYSGDAVRTIAQGLIEYQRDGGKVILE